MESNVLGIVLADAKRQLKNAGILEYALDAELFMMKALKMNRIQILTSTSEIINEEQKIEFEADLKRRLNNEPTAYILGCREFMGLDFKVKKGVLIPRPDTEVLVETVIEHVKKNTGIANIAEVGVGTGCISISIAKYSNAECHCTDINPVAVELARENAEINELSDRVHIYEGNIFKGLPSYMMFDVIVSNPPYIRKRDMETLMKDVKDYEPENALLGGEDGLDFYRRITAESKKILKAGGYIFYEIGYDEAEEVRNILAENGFIDICVKKDLSGLDRVVWARREDFYAKSFI